MPRFVVGPLGQSLTCVKCIAPSQGSSMQWNSYSFYRTALNWSLFKSRILMNRILNDSWFETPGIELGNHAYIFMFIVCWTLNSFSVFFFNHVIFFYKKKKKKKETCDFLSLTPTYVHLSELVNILSPFLLYYSNQLFAMSHPVSPITRWKEKGKAVWHLELILVQHILAWEFGFPSISELRSLRMNMEIVRRLHTLALQKKSASLERRLNMRLSQTRWTQYLVCFLLVFFTH